MATITSLKETYTITLDGQETTLDKQLVLNKGIQRLNITDTGSVNAFNYQTLTDTWESDTAIPTEDELKAKGIEQMEYEMTLPTKESVQASGNQKLLDLGLTQAEATALTGYTPPVEE